MISFFTKPLEEPNVIPRTNPAEDPRLVEAIKTRRTAERALVNAKFEEDQFRARHKHEGLKPILIRGDAGTTMHVPVGCMKTENPLLTALCAATRKARAEFAEAQRVEAEVMQALGLLKTGGNT